MPGANMWATSMSLHAHSYREARNVNHNCWHTHPRPNESEANKLYRKKWATGMSLHASVWNIAVSMNGPKVGKRYVTGNALWGVQ